MALVDGNIFEYLNPISFGEIQKFCYAQFMRKLLAITTSLLCLFGSVQSAHGCKVPKNLSKMDVAFADIIFEGSIRAIENSKLVFDISDVIRGEYSEDQITVLPNFESIYETIEDEKHPLKTRFLVKDEQDLLNEFVDKYGNFTRVAVTTPRQFELFCEGGFEKDEITVDGQAREIVRSSVTCDYPLFSLKHPYARDFPIVIGSGRCETQYLYSIETYNELKNFDENSKILKTVEIQGIPEVLGDSTYYIESAGAGPLPWEVDDDSFANTAVRLFKENPDFFKSDFSTYENKEKLLSELGVDLVRIRQDIRQNTEQKLRVPSKDSELYIDFLYFVHLKKLVTELDVIRKVLDKDPSFADRLLESD